MTDVPIWVYFLFFGLLYIGIKRCFTNTIKIKKFIILPLALLCLSLYDSYDQMLQMPVSILVWMVSFLLTVCLGAYYVRNRKVQADRTNRLIKIPGDWSILILILIMFSVEFFVNYAKDTQAVYVNQSWFVLLMALLSGLMIGFTSGRNLMYFIKYYQVENINLSQ
jgi:hypothetical protein